MSAVMLQELAVCQAQAFQGCSWKCFIECGFVFIVAYCAKIFLLFLLTKLTIILMYCVSSTSKSQKPTLVYEAILKALLVLVSPFGLFKYIKCASMHILVQ